MYYKVVRNESGQLYSAIVTPSNVRVLYVPNVRTVAPVGGCFIFRDADFANDFVGTSIGTFEVWECTAENARAVCAVLSNEKATLDQVKLFWQGLPSNPVGFTPITGSRTCIGVNPFEWVPPFEGTLVADAVTLLRRVS